MTYPIPVDVARSAEARLIRDAVRDCVANCQDWNKPVGEIREYVAALIRQGWSQFDANSVGWGAWKVLEQSAFNRPAALPPPESACVST